MTRVDAMGSSSFLSILLGPLHVRAAHVCLIASDNQRASETGNAVARG